MSPLQGSLLRNRVSVAILVGILGVTGLLILNEYTSYCEMAGDRKRAEDAARKAKVVQMKAAHSSLTRQAIFETLSEVKALREELAGGVGRGRGACPHCGAPGRGYLWG